MRNHWLYTRNYHGEIHFIHLAWVRHLMTAFLPLPSSISVARESLDSQNNNPALFFSQKSASRQLSIPSDLAAPVFGFQYLWKRRVNCSHASQILAGPPLWNVNFSLIRVSLKSNPQTSGMTV